MDTSQGSGEVLRLVWASDIHLDMVSVQAFQEFAAEVLSHDPDGIVLTGDISNGNQILRHLTELEKHLELPIWFVHGNHDFYGSSAQRVRKDVAALSTTTPNLNWLGGLTTPVRLSETTVLIGRDGWADGRAGVGAERSPMELNDEFEILELSSFRYDRTLLAGAMALQADKDTEYLKAQLEQLPPKVTNVVLATHVPPYEEASRYRDQPASPESLPYFCNVGLGKMLTAHVQTRPDLTITVLCGHTHDPAYYEPTPQIRVHTAGAQYRRPAVAGVIDAQRPTPQLENQGRSPGNRLVAPTR